MTRLLFVLLLGCTVSMQAQDAPAALDQIMRVGLSYTENRVGVLSKTVQTPRFATFDVRGTSKYNMLVVKLDYWLGREGRWEEMLSVVNPRHDCWYVYSIPPAEYRVTLSAVAAGGAEAQIVYPVARKDKSLPASGYHNICKEPK